MQLLKKVVIYAAILLMAMPVTGFAQYEFKVDPFFSYFTDKYRYELGFNFGAFCPGEFTGVVPFGGLGTGQGDTTTKINLVSSTFGGSIGLSVPFKATGHISCWAMDFTLMANMYTWTDLNQYYTIDGTFHKSKPSLQAGTMQIGLPIGVSWKVGCDAIETRRLGFCSSMGVGFIPQYDVTTLNNVQDVKSGTAFGCTPYAKLEFGENLFMCAKLRVMYTMGNITFIDVNHYIPNVTDGPFKVTNTSNLYISLILMPFSPGWHETAWWNTHDTYNIHDRLN